MEAGGENTIYGWTPMGPRAIFPQEGSVLSGSQNSCDLNWTYTCTAMNPVSKSISSLNLVRQLCAGNWPLLAFLGLLGNALRIFRKSWRE